MAYSFLIFDFGADEDAAQQARHRIEGWRQGFRLDKKLQLKFERTEQEAEQNTATEPSSKASRGNSKAKSASKTKAKSKPAGDANAESVSNPAAASEIRMIVRLDFSDHEKLSHQRWLERIPTEAPFITAKPKVIRPGGPEFVTTEELFDSLD